MPAMRNGIPQCKLAVDALSANNTAAMTMRFGDISPIATVEVQDHPAARERLPVAPLSMQDRSSRTVSRNK